MANDYTTQILSYEDGIYEKILEVEQKSHKSPWTYDEIKTFFMFNYHVIGLFYKNDLVGYSLISAIYEDCELLSIGVIPSHRGKGQGRALLTKTIAVAKDLECEKVFLEVRTQNSIAIGLYESMGFKKMGLRKGYYPKTQYEESDDAFTMQLEIQA